MASMRTYIWIGLIAFICNPTSLFCSLYTLPSPKPELPTRAIFVVNGARDTLWNAPDIPMSAQLMCQIVQKPEAYIIASDWAVAGILPGQSDRAFLEKSYREFERGNCFYLWESYQKLRRKVTFYRFYTEGSGTIFWIILSDESLSKTFTQAIKSAEAEEALTKRGIELSIHHAPDELPDLKTGGSRHSLNLIDFKELIPALKVVGIANNTQLIWHIMGHGQLPFEDKPPMLAEMPLDDFVDFVRQCQKLTFTRGIFATSCYFTGDNSTRIARGLRDDNIAFPIVSEGVHNVPLYNPPLEGAFNYAGFARESLKEAPLLKSLVEDVIFRGDRLIRQGTLRAKLHKIPKMNWGLYESYPFVLLPGAKQAIPLFPAITIGATMSAARDRDDTLALRFPKKVSPDIPAHFRRTLYCLITTPYVPFPLDISKVQRERKDRVRVIPARPFAHTYAFERITIDDTDPKKALAPFLVYARQGITSDWHETFPTLLIKELHTTSGLLFTEVVITYQRNEKLERSGPIDQDDETIIELHCFGKDRMGALAVPFAGEYTALWMELIPKRFPSYLKSFDQYFSAAIASWEKDEAVQRALAAKKAGVGDIKRTAERRRIEKEKEREHVKQLVEQQLELSNVELKKSIDKQWTLPKELQ